MGARGFEVMSRECDQCLVTSNRIVPGSRAAQIIRGCRAGNKHFICHKSPPGREIACRGVHDMQIGQMSRIAERLGVVVNVDPETLEVATPSNLTPPPQSERPSGERAPALSATDEPLSPSPRRTAE